MGIGRDHFADPEPPDEDTGIKVAPRPGPALYPNAPINVWPNMAFFCHADLAWLVRNQANIVKARRVRPMEKTRPIKAWPNGRVRIEFVGNWPSAAAARQELEPLLSSLPPDLLALLKAPVP